MFQDFFVVLVPWDLNFLCCYRINNKIRLTVSSLQIPASFNFWLVSAVLEKRAIKAYWGWCYSNSNEMIKWIFKNCRVYQQSIFATCTGPPISEYILVKKIIWNCEILCIAHDNRKTNIERIMKKCYRNFFQNLMAWDMHKTIIFILISLITFDVQ